MKKPQPMKPYRLEGPSGKTIRHGQGRLPAVYVYTAPDGERFEIPFGAIAECRETCRFPFEYSEVEGSWLVHKDFLTITKTRWKQL